MAKKPTAYILRGLPGCGKSTFCSKHKTAQIICRDDIRAAFGINGHDSMSYQRGLPIEPLISLVAITMLKAHAARGVDIIIDETHTTQASIEVNLKHLVGYRIVVVQFNTDAHVCRNRRLGIGPDVFIRMVGNMRDSEKWLEGLEKTDRIERVWTAS